MSERKAWVCFKRSVVIDLTEPLDMERADQCAEQTLVCAKHRDRWPQCGEYKQTWAPAPIRRER